MKQKPQSRAATGFQSDLSRFCLVMTSGQKPANVAGRFMALFSPSRQVLLQHLKTGHYRFLPHPFLFTILHHTLYATRNQLSSRISKNAAIKTHKTTVLLVVL
jgi:hypothetical protein